MKSDKVREERRRNIIALLEDHESLSVNELSGHFKVTGATIRSDLQALADRNRVIRAHGRAVIVRERPVSPLAKRIHTMAREKQGIGRAAADMVNEGDIIGLDASSTAMAIARALKERNQLTVVTNCMPVAEEFVNSKQVKVIMPGGQLKHDSASVVGSGAVQFLAGLRVNTSFVGAHSLSLETGLGERDQDEIEIKRTLLAIARTKVIVADTSKWERVSLASFAGWKEVDGLITDDGIPGREKEALLREDVKVTAVETTERINGV